MIPTGSPGSPPMRRTERPHRFLAALAAALFAFLAASAAQAHLTDVAVLKLSALDDGRFTVRWELEPNKDRETPLLPIYPPQCVYAQPMLDCGEEGLAGELGFDGIGDGQAAAMFKIEDRSGAVRVYTLTPSSPTAEIRPAFDAGSWAGLAEVFSAYAAIGFEHILAGVDHLLFVLGLIWIARGGWMLFKTITAFTVAHSLTLAAASFGWVGVPETFVNALIALSIVFIGVEALKAQAGGTSLTLRHPWAVSFGFGLLHGFGFATALIDLGLPSEAAPIALFAFNVGVELGQIAFVLLVFALVWSCRVMAVRWPRWSIRVPAYGIGCLASLWFFQRVALMIGS